MGDGLCKKCKGLPHPPAQFSLIVVWPYHVTPLFHVSFSHKFHFCRYFFSKIFVSICSRNLDGVICKSNQLRNEMVRSKILPWFIETVMIIDVRTVRWVNNLTMVTFIRCSLYCILFFIGCSPHFGVSLYTLLILKLDILT